MGNRVNSINLLQNGLKMRQFLHQTYHILASPSQIYHIYIYLYIIYSSDKGVLVWLLKKSKNLLSVFTFCLTAWKGDSPSHEFIIFYFFLVYSLNAWVLAWFPEKLKQSLNLFTSCNWDSLPHKFIIFYCTQVNFWTEGVLLWFPER